MKLLNLKPKEHVLDVGSGIGGGDFYMARVRCGTCHRQLSVPAVYGFLLSWLLDLIT